VKVGLVIAQRTYAILPATDRRLMWIYPQIRKWRERRKRGRNAEIAHLSAINRRNQALLSVRVNPKASPNLLRVEPVVIGVNPCQR